MMDQPRDKFRRAIVILSDGEDNQSRYTREQALEMAHKADAVIYTISTNITHLETSGDKVLKRYAEETGGIAFFPFKAEDMAQSFENIANELRHQYNVFYRPDPLRTDGLYHPVTIRVKDRKDFTVRARHGYYAPTLPLRTQELTAGGERLLWRDRRNDPGGRSVSRSSRCGCGPWVGRNR